MSPIARSFAVLIAVVALTGCRPEYPKCKTDDHCADKGEVCVDGLCQECESDAQCREGYTCKSNKCVELPQCRLDADCGEGLRCRNEKCVPECASDRECASSERCENNRCVAAQSCTSSDDCGYGQSCRAGKCVPGTDDDASREEAARRARLQNCELQTVRFGFNEFALSDEARQALEQNAECIQFHGKNVLVAGHADERGTEEYNLVLAENRANAAKRYLTGLGVDAKLLRTVSYGEERPVDRGQNEAAWARNRRAEFSFR